MVGQGIPQDWKAAGLQWISEYFEMHDDAPPLSCSQAEITEHAQFIGDCVSTGIDPTHFVETLLQLQASRRTIQCEESMISYRGIDYSRDTPTEVGIEESLAGWIADNQGGCIETRMDKLEMVTARLLQLGIESGKIPVQDAADMLDADGEHFKVHVGNKA